MHPTSATYIKDTHPHIIFDINFNNILQLTTRSITLPLLFQFATKIYKHFPLSPIKHEPHISTFLKPEESGQSRDINY
jgi:accessory gene regulator protein AgrB